MTQDVQPLTWQKRTNLEEHQQFFSKINEIIDNLAPTVDEAEAAIAQATAAIASANDAIATANAASAAASAAATQAQTAASTVAGYDTRLTAVEGEADTNADNITALQGRMGVAEGNITALQGVQGDYVKKAGAAQTVTSQIMVPTTATGLRDTQIANGTRIQNDLDNYAGMIRTTGSQTKSGVLTLTSVDPVKVKQTTVSWAGPTPTFYLDRLVYSCDKDERKTVELYATHDAGGQNNAQLVCTGYAADENGEYTVSKRALINLQVRSTDGKCRLVLQTPAGQNIVIQDWIA